MAWIVIVLGALLVIGPIFWIMPSARDRRLAELRSTAAKLGLELADVELPQTRRQRVRLEETQRGMLYRAPLLQKPAVPVPLVRWVREAPDAPWVREGEPPLEWSARLDAVLEQLPRSVCAFELGARGPAIYWREQGNEETVRQLAALLKPLAAELRGRTDAEEEP
ncbi:MAG: hypothetical protein RBS88_00995 [Spongiibacteraceae bacterium]|jgi:hypothetical protein|nr:hypothetical protein [Spongiibacteraceae bacterium]